MKNKLKQLVAYSYNDRQLDEKKVNSIVTQLSRKDLKQYISLLKEEERKKEVIVTSAQALSPEELDQIQRLFPEKKIVATIDPAMITGVKIVENDQEFEINLNRTLHDIIRFLSRND